MRRVEAPPGRPRLAAPLRAGDTVAVVAPSGPVDVDRLDRGVHRLRRWGLQVRIGAHVGDCAHRGMLAGNDADRAKDLVTALTDPDVRAVLAARGGYGVTRLLPHLPWTRLSAAAARWVVGSSDVTALHAAITRRIGWPCVLGPMPASEVLGGEDADERSWGSLRGVLLGETTQIVVRATDAAWAWPHGADGPVEGRLVGGNLTLLAALLGTSEMPDAADAIVVLEDVGEAAYRIDRLLTQLLAAGWFERVRGVALGSFEQCGDPHDVRAVLWDRFAPLRVPVLGALPLGHGRPQESVVLGWPARLDVGAGQLECIRPACAPG